MHVWVCVCECGAHRVKKRASESAHWLADTGPGNWTRVLGTELGSWELNSGSLQGQCVPS